MKGKYGHTWILLLMIISQTLLILLVILWLRSQYKSEKDLVAEELRTLYLSTHDEMVDTLLFKSYVSPVISKDSSGSIRHVITVRDSQGGGLPLKIRPDSDRLITWNGGKQAISVRVNPLHDTIRLRQADEDMLLRSVRMIVTHVSDSAGSGPDRQLMFKIKVDSTAFIRQLTDKMSAEDMKFRIKWDSHLQHSGSGNGRNNIIIYSPAPFSLPSAEVTGYGGYILNRILPQVIFGLILVFITAFAFYISYRGLRSNMIMNRLRNEFISNMTHELRTPVTTISVALESVGKFNLENNPEVTRQYLNLASAETGRLGELINRILDLTLIEEDRYPFNPVVSDLNPLINDVVTMMKQKLDKGGVLEFVPSGENLLIKCDPLFISGALINLVENSIRYCDKVPVIRISAEKEDGNSVIRINDNGPGIPEEFHKKIFEKFFRVPSGNIHNVKGYGLGLSFVKRVVALHKGNVEVKNLSPGCSFILKIPLAS